MAVTDRPARVAAVLESLEHNMDLLCLTGVEDKLQENCRESLEMLRNANIKVTLLLTIVNTFYDVDLDAHGRQIGDRGMYCQVCEARL